MIQSSELANKEERPLVARLSGEHAIAWRPIFKAKGLDAAAVVIADVTPEAMLWANEHILSCNDLLYVGMTLARYECTVLPRHAVARYGRADARAASRGSARSGRGRSPQLACS